MLGNKCEIFQFRLKYPSLTYLVLDDNTYTNKTWAEVSGISVTEIHVMEVEFLSNMRYSLLASKEQWREWQEKLGKFWDYCDAATKAPLPQLSPGMVSNLQPNLPSPPNSIQASPPPLPTVYPPSSSTTHPQNWSRSSYAAPIISPLHTIPDLDHILARKRSYDADAEEPAAKRRLAGPPSTSFPSNIPPIRLDAPRLPIPNLTISTSQPYGSSYHGPNSFPQNAPLLPPLSGRALSTVYPTTPTRMSQAPILTPIGAGSLQGTHSANSSITPRRQSPYLAAHDLLSLGSSPVSANFTHHINSPSFYLQQRASPYKPVRHVNTLLYPPPSSSMHEYSMNVEHMHYQPLGKKHEYRSGVAYPQQPWPAMPQPKFHP